jgi:AraC-like DNA-binding protein
MSSPVHLVGFERTLYSGGEWPVCMNHWLVLQHCEGVAYMRSAGKSTDLQLNAVAVVPPNAAVSILASMLGTTTVRGVGLQLESLAGFLTALERLCLESQVAQRCSPFFLLPPSHSLAVRLPAVCHADTGASLHHRLAFLHAFSEAVAPFLAEALAQQDTVADNAKAKLRQLIHQMPESELASLTITNLARQMSCCERHASRLFRELCGCSYRSYVSEARLKKACDLLRNPKLKIIHVALESGHSSLAFFNDLFKRRFGITPSEWRQRHMQPGARRSRARAPLWRAPRPLVLPHPVAFDDPVPAESALRDELQRL